MWLMFGALHNLEDPNGVLHRLSATSHFIGFQEVTSQGDLKWEQRTGASSFWILDARVRYRLVFGTK